MKGQGVTDCRGIRTQAGHIRSACIVTACAIGAMGGEEAI